MSDCLCIARGPLWLLLCLRGSVQETRQHAAVHSSLRSAARSGSVECCKILLEHGYGEWCIVDVTVRLCAAQPLPWLSDHFAKNAAGLRPIHVASAAGKVPVVRYLEAATCPFMHEVEVKNVISGDMCTWHERWVTVHRAAPGDNAEVARGDSIVHVFTGAKYSASYAEVRNGAVQVVRREEGGTLVRFNIETPVLEGEEAAPPAGKVVSGVQCRAPLHVFEWLRDVLDGAYGDGGGPRLDAATGRPLIPAWAMRDAGGARLAPQPRPADILAARGELVAEPEVDEGEYGGGASVARRGAPAGSLTTGELVSEAGFTAATSAYGAARSMLGPAVADTVFGHAVAKRHAAVRKDARKPSAGVAAAAPSALPAPAAEAVVPGEAAAPTEASTSAKPTPAHGVPEIEPVSPPAVPEAPLAPAQADAPAAGEEE